MIKRIGYFLLGFLTALVLLFWPRRSEVSEELYSSEELYDAEFHFGLQDSSDSMVEQLKMAGYTYVGDIPLPNGQHTQWLYMMKDAPKWAIKEHHNLLLQLGIDPGMKIFSRNDGKELPVVRYGN